MNSHKVTYRRNFALILLIGYSFFLSAGIFHQHHTSFCFSTLEAISEHKESIPVHKTGKNHQDCLYCYIASIQNTIIPSFHNIQPDTAKPNYVTAEHLKNITQKYFSSLSNRAPPLFV